METYRNEKVRRSFRVRKNKGDRVKRKALKLFGPVERLSGERLTLTKRA